MNTNVLRHTSDTVLFILALLALAGSAFGQEPELPHGPLTRDMFVAAKTGVLVDGAGLKANNGELGDAAALSDRYDMVRCGLVFRLNPALRLIEGDVTLVFTSEFEGLGQAVFDMRDALTVNGVSHTSGALTFVHEGDSLVVTLPTPLAVGSTDSVTIVYEGNTTEPLSNRGLLFRTHTAENGGSTDDLVPVVANLSQPAYAQTWWPCKDKPGDKFLVSMDVTVPDTLVAVSNGTLLGVEPAEPGWMTYRWAEAYPIATYLVSVAVSDYVLLAEDCQTSGGSFVPLRHWVFPKDQAAAEIEFADMCPMMEFCEQNFGPYPFQGEKYGHAEFIWNGAMEHQTVTSIGHGSFNPPGTHQWLVMHELAHQWFGDSLTPAEWADVWLNEGFATYAEALWFEETEGTAAYHEFMDMKRNEADWLRQGPVYDPMPVFPGRVIYDKGAWILHILRGRMGDAAFFGMIEEWSDGGGRPLDFVVTQELIDLAESWAGEDLDDAVWPYLNETELPRLAFDYTVTEDDAASNYRVNISLRQVQRPFYDLVLPLVVTTAAGPETRRLHLSSLTLAQEFEFYDPIVSVELDPDHWGLWNPAQTGGGSGGIELAYPNPSPDGVINFRFTLGSPSRVVLRIFDAMGHDFSTTDYGIMAPEAGYNEVTWDGRGSHGRRAPSAIYWASLEVNGVRSVRKFSVIR